MSWSLGCKAAARGLIIVWSVLVSVSTGWAQTPASRVLPVDPIELIAGNEVAGEASLSQTYEGIEYRFASAENLQRFASEPNKYSVADGGACGRMGPLSGMGDARRYAVHDGRIYFFASDGCRAGFLSDPAKHIELPEEMIFGSNEQVLQGRARLDKVVAWAGGAERLREFQSFEAKAERVETQGGQEWRVVNRTLIKFPSNYYASEAWNESWFSTASCAAGGVMASSRGSERIASSRETAFVREMSRWPLVILKAHVDGSPGAECPGLIVLSDGEGELDGFAVEYVNVWLNGATSRLTVDRETGKLLQMSFHGRDGSMTVGDSVRIFTEYQTVDGVTLPTAYQVNFNGKLSERPLTKIDSFEFDVAIDEEIFEVPAWPSDAATE